MKVEVKCEGKDVKTFNELDYNDFFVVDGRVCFKSEEWEATDISNGSKFDVDSDTPVNEIDSLKISYTLVK